MPWLNKWGVWEAILVTSVEVVWASHESKRSKLIGCEGFILSLSGGWPETVFAQLDSLKKLASPPLPVQYNSWENRVFVTKK